jgi:hypothetical protein
MDTTVEGGASQAVQRSAEQKDAKPKKTKRAREETDDSDSDDESAGSLKEFIVEGGDSVVSEEVETASAEDVNLLKTEAERFAGNVTGTVLGGRVLRSRDPESIAKRKPKDEYYDRFGRNDEARVMEKFMKKDIIDYIQTLADDYKSDYETAGHTWPKLTMKNTMQTVRSEYDKIKAFADLPDTDDEDAEDDAEEDAEEAEDSEEDSEEESEEDSEESDEESEEESDEESSDDE